MRPKLLQKRFFALCSAYAKETGAFGWETSAGKKRCTADFLYRTVRIQLVYRPKEGVGIPPSTLYCRVYPDKNTPIWMHIPQLLPLLGYQDYRAVYFPYIESGPRMEACFGALAEFLGRLLSELERLGAVGGDRELLKALISQEISWAEPEEVLRKDSFQQKNFLSIQDANETLLLIRYTQSKPWYLYLLGERKAALKQLRSQRDLSAYDAGLCDFLESPVSKGFLPITDECFALRDKDSLTRGKEDILTMGLCALVLFGIFAAVLCLVMALVQIISARGTSCWFGPPWYSGALFAALPAMFGGIALRRQLIALLFPKNASRKLEFDDIISDTPLVRYLSRSVFAITAAGVLLLIPVVGSSQVQLYEDRGTIHHSLFEHQSFTYDEVEVIYHIQSRYNDFGDRLELDSYVIATQDGQLTDLYGFASGEETRKKALPIFQNAGIPVIDLDSDRDLPQTDDR